MKEIGTMAVFRQDFRSTKIFFFKKTIFWRSFVLTNSVPTHLAFFYNEPGKELLPFKSTPYAEGSFLHFINSLIYILDGIQQIKHI